MHHLNDPDCIDQACTKSSPLGADLRTTWENGTGGDMEV